MCSIGWVTIGADGAIACLIICRWTRCHRRSPHSIFFDAYLLEPSRASSPGHLETQWRLFLATQGVYTACYRGVYLGTALVPESGEAVRIAE